MRGYLSLLARNPGFFRLWAAQAISMLGDWFSTIALSTLVAFYSGGSGIAVSLLLLARFFPPLLVGPFAGVLVDRLDRRTLLIVSDMSRALIVLVFLLVRSADMLWLVYLLTVIQFCFSALFEPGRSALLPSLVSPQDLVQANVLGSVTWSVMLAAGAAIGGLVAASLGTSIALVIDAVSFAASALLILSTRPHTMRPPHRADVELHTGLSTQRGFVDGLRYALAHPATAATLLVKMGGSVGSIDALMIIYATRLFVIGENGAGSLGLFYAAFGVGAVAGPALIQRFNDGTARKMRRLIISGYAFIALGWFLFGGAPSLLLAALALIVKAMGSSIYWTYSSAIIQKTVPDQFLGRMFSLDLAGFQFMTVISTVITGALIEQSAGDSVRLIVIGTGIASIVPLLLWALAVPRIEQIAPAETPLSSAAD